MNEQVFLGSEDDCYRFIAAVAWPLEREENRDAWAVTMRDRPELLALEVERARARLEACIARVYSSGYAVWDESGAFTQPVTPTAIQDQP